eukprot:CAMPEP_0206560806 /NCGR_PEP_ID=MMETSP0325_2-20121206/21236_1 /ASSEMBLY_ACC=CAM_ASM_000347 /TAXON_ID=2866 /ORGANISM="Crypthecodinium cohnii, Strain Seligo" /LENGTH=291 /DNA_ID=CAMNT_0054062623 /DNA_START=113 /DNA_END=983 /DNA_ORIENTATION=-
MTTGVPGVDIVAGYVFDDVASEQLFIQLFVAQVVGLLVCWFITKLCWPNHKDYWSMADSLISLVIFPILSFCSLATVWHLHETVESSVAWFLANRTLQPDSLLRAPDDAHACAMFTENAEKTPDVDDHTPHHESHLLRKRTACGKRGVLGLSGIYLRNFHSLLDELVPPEGSYRRRSRAQGCTPSLGQRRERVLPLDGLFGFPIDAIPILALPSVRRHRSIPQGMGGGYLARKILVPSRDHLTARPLHHMVHPAHKGHVKSSGKDESRVRRREESRVSSTATAKTAALVAT